MDLEKLLRFAVDQAASDVHLQAGSRPMLRIAGQLKFVEARALSVDEVRDIISRMAPPGRGTEQAALYEGMDFAYALADSLRFRCSISSHLGTPGVVMRTIEAKIPSIEELHLPAVAHDIALAQRGMILICGTTSSGKSTTLAAMVGLINQTHRSKIITIEDPVEFVHADDKSLISQVEVGLDTPSFDRALRQALRQDPDVILVGELRDVDTLRIALRAADTGHQVFSTVHSATASQTVERIIAMFPPNEHKLLLSQLAGSIEAIIAQRLVMTRESGRRPAVEILRGTAVTQKFVLENRLSELHSYMEGGDAGMQTFDQHLLAMHKQGLVAGTEALRWASNPEALSMAMRGITRVGSGRSA